jgi:hypothetical protein
LIVTQKMKLPAWSLDIKAVFLNGDLTKEIFMRVPDEFGRIHGEEMTRGKVVRLNESIHRLVQAARQ